MNKDILEKRYRQLQQETVNRFGDDTFSFIEGAWADQEYFKRQVWKEAHDALMLETWEEHRGDSGYILSRAFDAIMKSDNLLSRGKAYEDGQLAYESQRDKAVSCLYLKKDKAASAIYDIFYCDAENEEKCFNTLAVILKSVYDSFSFVAYFFFLKDPSKYSPVRRDADKIALSKLHADAACMDQCTWANYMIFMGVIHDIYDFLRERHAEIELIDAQSFLWMMWMVDAHNSQEYVESTDPLETTFLEGKKVIVYGTKYERDPKVRKAFLKSVKKPYRCEVCGMDFQSIYGDIGKDVIEVHHKKPLYFDGEEQEIKPSCDYLACLCANCHRMIHKTVKGQIMTVEQLKGIVSEEKK